MDAIRCTMSFLKSLGIKLVDAAEDTHKRTPNKKINKARENAYVHKNMFCLPFYQRLFSQEVDCYIDHPTAGLLASGCHFDDEGDLIVDDYECPDCKEDGGCSHCELEHLKNHKCVAQPTRFSTFLKEEIPPKGASWDWFQGKFCFRDGSWAVCSGQNWIEVKLTVDGSVTEEKRFYSFI